jgi:hypothetical protein
MKIYKVLFNDGSFYSSGIPEIMVVAESIEDAKDKALEKNPKYSLGYDVWVKEFEIEGYVIEVFEKKSYDRDKSLDKIFTFPAKN